MRSAAPEPTLVRLGVLKADRSLQTHIITTQCLTVLTHARRCRCRQPRHAVDATILRSIITAGGGRALCAAHNAALRQAVSWRSRYGQAPAADLAFVRRERLPVPPPSGFADIAPDLVIEVLSPNDRPGEVLSKIGDWLDAGVLLVWIIDPQRGDARVYRADGSQDHLGVHDWLDGESVVPGFRWPIDNLGS